MPAPNLRVADAPQNEDVRTDDLLEIAMARFGYAVAGLSERDVMAVVELVERLTGEVKGAEHNG